MLGFTLQLCFDNLHTRLAFLQRFLLYKLNNAVELRILYTFKVDSKNIFPLKQKVKAAIKL